MALALAAPALVALAITAGAGPRLDVSPGLWETKSTTTTKMDGDLPGVDPSKLSPEQRARLEAVRERLASGKPVTTVHRSCVTQEQIDKGLGLDDATGQDKECERQYLDQSPKHVRVAMKCAPKGGGVTMEGTWEATVKASDLVVMHGEMSTRAPGHSSTSKMEMTAHRLGSSCGDIEPGKSKTVSE